MSDTTATVPPQWLPNRMLARLAFGGDMLSAGELEGDSDDGISLDLDDPAQRALGEYELLQWIGQGGMGVVYRARQNRLQRDVALKLLSAGPWASDRFVARFQQEAQHAARLQHPNIVTVYEIGEHRGLIYYAMELVDGVSLDLQLQRDGPMPARDAASLLRNVAEAVDYAHRLDVLHLDLKPGNVLMARDGTAKISDFGLARRLQQGAGIDNDHVSGTPDYMAPEQAQLGAGNLGRATDVWGLGAILYEVLTGQPPFRGERAQDLIEHARTRTVEPPGRLRAGIPADLEAICLHCLERDPQQRYPTARALADDLSRFLEGRAVSVRPLNAMQRLLRWARREPRLAAASALTAAALIAGVVATSLQWRRAEHNASRVVAESERVRSSLWSQRRDAAWHQFAGNDAFSALPLLTANLREAEAGGARADAQMERLRIGLLLDSSPRLIDVITLGKRISAVALSGDGRLIAAGCRDGEIRLFDTASGRERWRVATAEFPKMLNDIDQIAHLAFTPDGRQLLAMGGWPTPVINPSGQSMMLIEVASGRLQSPPPSFPHFQDASFSSDGRSALLRGSDGTARAYRTGDWTPLGPVVHRNYGTGAWLFSAQARHLAVWHSGRKGGIDVDLLDPRTLALRHSTAQASAWAFSPDNRWLALGDDSGAVRLLDTADGSERRLAPQPSARVNWLSFSADGAWLASASEPGEIRAWNVEDGAPLMPPIRRSMAAWVKIDRSSGLLAARVDNRLQLFQITDGNTQPVPVGPALTNPGLVYGYSTDVDFERGLVATGGGEGELRLWRLGNPWREIGTPAPAVPAADRPFDGRHLSYAEAMVAGVLDARDGRRLARPLPHPQPVYFAELDVGAQTLVTLSGREVRAWNWRTGRLRHPPWQLAQTPQRVALSPSGDRLAFTYGRAQADDFVEVLRILDLRRGMLPAEHALAGPLSGLRFSPDGARVVAWGRASPGPRIFAADTLAPSPLRLRIPYADADVRDVAFSQDGKTLHAVLAADWNLSRGNQLLRWDTGNGALQQRIALAGEPLTLAVSAEGSRIAVGGPTRTVLDARGRVGGRLPEQPDQEPLLSTALSADGRWVAFASARGVQLADARNGQPLAPPLMVPVTAPDWIASLVFAADGRSLLATTWFGRRLVWALQPDTRTVAEISDEAQLLSAGEADYGAPLSSALTGESRAALRRRDPGAHAPLPPLRAAVRPIAQRSSTLSPLALDLGRFYTTALDQAAAQGGLIDLSRLPRGHQRLLGVDYDIRGFIGLTMKGLGSEWGGSPLDRMVGIPVGQKASALSILGTSGTQAQSRQATELGRVVLHYRGGGSATVPLIWGRDFVAFWEDPLRFRQPRVAWLMQAVGGWGSDGTLLFEIRVANPHPQRLIESIDLESTDQYWSAPMFVAITLQPVDAASAGVAHSDPPMP